MSNSSYQYFQRDTFVVSTVTTISKPVTCIAEPATLYVPTGFNAADITYQSSIDEGGTWGPIKDINGNAIKTTAAAANDVIALDPAVFQGIQMLRCVFSVAQTTTNPFILIYTPVLGKYFA